MSTSSRSRLGALGLAAICGGTFMVMLDALIGNVAVNPMRQALGLSLRDLQWVSDGYSLCMSLTLLLSGSLADRMGARRLFAFGLGVFTLGSAACALSAGAAFLITARMVQGLGAGFIIPCGMSMINRCCPEADQRNKVLGLWAACSSLGVAAGPLVGGVLVSAFGWHSVYWVNVPVGFLTLWALRSVPECHGQKNSEPMGWVSMGLGALVLSALLWVLIDGRGMALSHFVVCLLGLVLLGGLFLVHQRRTAMPLVPEDLRKAQGFLFLVGNSMVLRFAYVGFIFMISLYLQVYRGYTPMAAGLALMPMTLLQPFLCPFMAKWIVRKGTRTPMIAATSLALVGAVLALFIGPVASRGLLAVVMLCVGLGSALAFQPITAAVLSVAPLHRSGTASSLYTTLSSVAGTLGIACLGSLVQRPEHFMAGFHIGMIMLVGLAVVGLGMGIAHVENSSREVEALVVVEI